MRDALLETRYKKRRSEFGPAELIPMLRRHPHLMEEWAHYSEDKRTNGGWYLSGLDIGRVGIVDSVVSFQSVEQAVAGYVVRELEICTNLGGVSCSCVVRLGRERSPGRGDRGVDPRPALRAPDQSGRWGEARIGGL